MSTLFRQLLVILTAISLGACSTLVGIDSSSARDYHNQRRGDILSSGKISAYSREIGKTAGVDIDLCLPDPTTCQARLLDNSLVRAEAGLSTVSELWLSYALARDGKRRSSNNLEAITSAYLEAARFSYAYLFTLPESAATRAFEDRQTQVRDFYNYATERIASLLIEQQQADTNPPVSDQIQIGQWQLHINIKDIDLSSQDLTPIKAIAVSRLRFSGLRSGYQNDGIGAPFLININQELTHTTQTPRYLVRSRYVPATVLIRFPKLPREELLTTRTAILEAYNPEAWDQVDIQNTSVPLSANYTAPYAYWLSNSHFGSLAGRALFSANSTLNSPEIHLLQPYDPNRRIVVLIHGLASSPEAWVNLANDILGDAELRRHYQIWQVFYPTSVPIAINTHDIRVALENALRQVDPKHNHPATQQITLIGHSMGGVISRLLLLDSGDRLWNALSVGNANDPKRQEHFRMVAPYLTLTAMDNVGCAVFLASPHRGTPYADNWIAHLSRRLLRLPTTVVSTITTIVTSIGDDAPEFIAQLRGNFTSIHSLSDNDPYLKAVADLPIKPGVEHFSIIGQIDSKIPLADSSDGIVPYRSAHLASARTETIINSGHSVQETTDAIIQLRRILREPACKG